VGDDEWRKGFNQRVHSSWRLVKEGDLLPDIVPLDFLYRHVRGGVVFMGSEETTTVGRSDGKTLRIIWSQKYRLSTEVGLHAHPC
jgi:hypothetical protein